jgi:hypothetical protein
MRGTQGKRCWELNLMWHRVAQSQRTGLRDFPKDIYSGDNTQNKKPSSLWKEFEYCHRK